MIPTTIALVVVQEMASRMGAVTGKGLSDLIREEFGFRVTFFLMLALVVTNFGNVMAEFAGVASSLELFGVSRYIVVPLVAAAVVWLLVVQGTYSSVEKIFLVASGFYVCYIVAGVLAHPDWKAAAFATVTRPETLGHPQLRLSVYMLIGLVGTTIAPWMQFYLQASIVEKGVTVAAVPRVALGRHRRLPVRGRRRLVHHRRLRGDAALERDAPSIRDAADAAQALRPLAGEYAYLLFAAGLFNASLFAASILPISTAYAVCEGLGFESGLDKKFHEAPVVLLALHAAHRRRRRRAAGAALSARAHHGAVAGRQRRRAAVRADLHAAADQRPRADGRARQLAPLQHRRLDHGRA